MNHRKPKKSFDNYIKYTNIAFQMAAVIGIGVFGGIKLDGWLSLDFPVFTLLLSLISVAAAIYLSVKDFLKKP